MYLTFVDVVFLLPHGSRFSVHGRLEPRTAHFFSQKTRLLRPTHGHPFTFLLAQCEVNANVDDILQSVAYSYLVLSKVMSMTVIASWRVQRWRSTFLHEIADSTLTNKACRCFEGVRKRNRRRNYQSCTVKTRWWIDRVGWAESIRKLCTLLV